LAGKCDFDDALCSTDIEKLYMLFSGPVPPNPSELLGNKRFIHLIERAREEYDMVIIDTPPLGSVIDAAVVSKCCDGAVIVIASGNISYRFARKVKDQLDVAGCRILGCVLNKVDLSGKSYYGKYYGKYYGQYYGNYGE
jgi:capsular exopolysaccharide synthesis family protein